MGSGLARCLGLMGRLNHDSVDYEMQPAQNRDPWAKLEAQRVDVAGGAGADAGVAPAAAPAPAARASRCTGGHSQSSPAPSDCPAESAGRQAAAAAAGSYLAQIAADSHAAETASGFEFAAFAVRRGAAGQQLGQCVLSEAAAALTGAAAGTAAAAA